MLLGLHEVHEELPADVRVVAGQHVAGDGEPGVLELVDALQQVGLGGRGVRDAGQPRAGGVREEAPAFVELVLGEAEGLEFLRDVSVAELQERETSEQPGVEGPAGQSVAVAGFHAVRVPPLAALDLR